MRRLIGVLVWRTSNDTFVPYPETYDFAVLKGIKHRKYIQPNMLSGYILANIVVSTMWETRRSLSLSLSLSLSVLFFFIVCVLLLLLLLLLLFFNL